MVFGPKRSPSALGLLVLSGVSALMAAIQPARASDPASLAGTVVARNWTGCYAGVNAGWIGGADQILTHPGSGASLGPLTGLPAADAALLTNTYRSQDPAGFTGGGQVGCNWQRGGSPFVLGVEADVNGSGLKESRLAAYPGVTLPVTGVNIPARSEVVTTSLDWYSTLRGRLGLSWGRWLGYVTGGLAIAHIESGFELDTGPFAGSDSRTRFGWTGGAGLEYAFHNNWSLKVEYLYLDFGSYSYQVRHLTSDTRFWAVDVEAREHVVRAGLNYKF